MNILEEKIITFARASDCEKSKYAIPGLKLGQVGLLSYAVGRTENQNIATACAFNLAFNIALGRNNYNKGGVLILSSSKDEDVIQSMQDLMSDFAIDDELREKMDKNIIVAANCHYDPFVNSFQADVANLLASYDRGYNKDKTRIVIIDNLCEFYHYKSNNGYTSIKDCNRWLFAWSELAREKEFSVLCVVPEELAEIYKHQSRISYNAKLSEISEYDRGDKSENVVMQCDVWMGLKPKDCFYSYGKNKILLDKR